MHENDHTAGRSASAGGKESGNAKRALSDRSLQEYLRAGLIDRAASPDAETLVARIRQRKGAIGGSLTAARIVEHRDADRA
jgi:hypothetical protein